MIVLFLDIDGVLNSTHWYKTRVRYPAPRTMEEYHEKEFDPVAVSLIKEIIAKTGAKVVLSSTWRLNHENRKAVKKYAVDFIGITPQLSRPTNLSWEYRERGREVNAWLMDNPEVTKYAILDDDPDFFDWQPLFKTKNQDGLTREIADKVIVYLSTQ